MSDEKNINLLKQTLPQLQELLERQNVLLRNRKLLDKLKDKGESVKHLHDKIEKEIQHRKDLESIQASLSALALNSNENYTEILKEKHAEYVCSKEKPIEDTRYRPHRTLIHKVTKTSPKKSPKKFVEVTSAFEPELKHEPTKCIPLAESLSIQNEQACKIMEEQAKKTLKSLHDALEESSGDDTDGDEVQEHQDEVPTESEIVK